MTDKVKKVFELLGVEPYERFKIKDRVGTTWEEKYFLDENLDTWYINGKKEKTYFSDTTVLRLLTGYYEIIKIPRTKKTPKIKKKLRDLRPVDLADWQNGWKHCGRCEQCPFDGINCTLLATNDDCWVNHKDLYSDKFLNQEIEVE